MHKPSIKIGLIGTGKVATAICDWFSSVDHLQIDFLLGRTPQKVQPLASAYHIKGYTSFAALANVDTPLIIMAVSDAQIATVASYIAPYLKGHQLLVHTSGATPMAVLQHATPHHGIWYPLQTFTAGRKLNYQHIPLVISAAHPNGLQLLQQLGQQLGNPTTVMNDDDRRVLHVAAVFANNFTNALYHLAFQIMENNQLDPQLLLPLIRETAEKLSHHTPTDSQTGPAIRNDQPTIDRHLNSLAENPEWQTLYRALTHYIQKNR